MSTGEFEDQIRQMIAVIVAERANAVKLYDDAIQALENLSRTTQVSAWIAPAGAERPKESSAARTRRIITAIMKEANGSISISVIAHTADNLGLLTSKRGYKGVYADVARVLIRNQHLFVKAEKRGYWKLKELASLASKSTKREDRGTRDVDAKMPAVERQPGIEQLPKTPMLRSAPLGPPLSIPFDRERLVLHGKH